MKFFSIVLSYLKWHYSQAIVSLSAVWKNFFSFLCGFFSLKLLLKNFFDPWKRMTDPYPRFFDFKNFFSTLVVNLITRVVGILMRSFLMLAGLVSLIIMVTIYIPIILIWFVLPLIVFTFIIFGLFLIIS